MYLTDEEVTVPLGHLGISDVDHAAVYEEIHLEEDGGGYTDI